ncbi:hypothetical protein LWT81_16575 [Enterobacter hormaechei]|uniref:hypothetical protein n=1 Tax=Enterobacter hormaechei TaxID=158836 RepID=UPI003F578F6C|nr:hypothetical protein [Enterobacter hormaechei]
MSTLTKEWLQQTIAELEEERDAVPGVVNEDAANALAAMKLALASLESGGEACEACGGNGSVDIDHGEMGIEHIECPKFYTSQPAPVSVPEWTNEQCLEFLSIAFRHAEIKGDLELDDIRLGVKMVNGSRAAMLQGAEPVTTANKLPFEQWLSQQTGTIDVECGCVMTEVFFHWLRVAYEDGSSSVVPDGLRLALSNAGIAAPESDEMLAATCEKYIQELVTWVKDRKPFQPAAPDFREIVNSSTNNCRENAETSTKCWCRTCRPITLTDMRFVVCPDCGNKRCPHANDHRNSCTGSNEPGQEGSAYPAAPQQEVK